MNSLYKIYNTGSTALKMFNVNIKADNAVKARVKVASTNYANKAKHYPPANKEWSNSIYAYNNNITKMLPSLDKSITRLMKSYFNLYSRKLENKVKSRRLTIRGRRLSTNRMLISRAELKHTSDKVIVTIYVFNQQKSFYLNKINRIATIDKVDEFVTEKAMERIASGDQPLPSKLIIRKINGKGLKLANKVTSQEKRFFTYLAKKGNGKITATGLNDKNLFIDNKNEIFKSYNKKYLKDYVSKALRKEIFFMFYKQLLHINKSKFEARYLLPITKLIERVYNKNVEFNLVNLKYLYLNSYIFSETLVTKLRNRRNKLLKVLKSSLLMFSLPRADGLAIYNEIYNRKKIAQNLKFNNVSNNNLACLWKKSKPNFKISDMDTLEQSLLKLNPCTLKLNDYKYTLKNVFNAVKHKFISGVRLEVAGRLTKRNTAARSVSKLKYIGNIKNMDSSNKGLSTVMLRNNAKSNVQYTFLKSRIRIGSFGLKGWVSSG